MKLPEKVNTVYNGFLQVKKLTFSRLDMLLGDAPPSREMEYMERGDSVSVLVRRGNNLIVLKQFRVGNFVREGKTSVYSNVAGMVDAGETAYQAAHRELQEELGLVAHEMFELGSFYTSPGGTTERMTFFLAEVTMDQEPKPQDREIHSCEEITIKEYRDAILEGRITSLQMASAFMLAEERWYL